MTDLKYLILPPWLLSTMRESNMSISELIRRLKAYYSTSKKSINIDDLYILDMINSPEHAADLLPQYRAIFLSSTGALGTRPTISSYLSYEGSIASLINEQRSILSSNTYNQHSSRELKNSWLLYGTYMDNTNSCITAATEIITIEGQQVLCFKPYVYTGEEDDSTMRANTNALGRLLMGTGFTASDVISYDVM